MFRKGQAAMEFLMTYGWAILVVLAAIGALAYFGVLSPDRFLPEKCTLPSGMACLDFSASGVGNTTFQLVIQNSGGFDMQDANVTLNPPAGSGIACGTVDLGPAGDLADGEQFTASVSCSGTSAGKFKAELEVNYVNKQTMLSHAKIGELIAKVS